MAKMKNWFSGFNKKQKIVFSVAAVLVVVLVGVLSWMATTGRLGISAAGTSATLQDMSADDVLLCQGADYTSCVYAQEQVANLAGTGLNDSVRSIAVGANVGNFLACENADYGGMCFPVPAGYMDSDVNDPWNAIDPVLRYNASQIDSMSSYVKLDRGRLIGDTLPTASSCEPGDNQVAVFGNANYSNVTSAGVGCVVLDVNYFSDYSIFSQAPNGTLRPGVAYYSPDAPAVTLYNDEISSVKVGKNARLTVYEGTGYTGSSRSFSTDVQNLDGVCYDGISSCSASNDVNDSITSLKVEAKTIDFTLSPPQQTLPPNTKFQGSTAYNARAVKPATVEGPITFKAQAPKSYVGGTLATGVKLENDIPLASIRTADLVGTTGTAGQYGHVGVDLLDGNGAVVAQRYANLKVATDAGICALTSSPASVNLIESGTADVTISTPSGNLPPASSIRATLYEGSSLSTTLRADTTTQWPKVRLTAPYGSAGNYTLVLEDTDNGCTKVSIPVTVSTGCSLTATPSELNLQESSTGTITITANQSISASYLKAEVYPDGAFGTTILSVDSSTAPTFKVTALPGSYGKSANIRFYDSRETTNSVSCYNALVRVTVGTLPELTIDPPTATVKTGEVKELYTVSGLVSNDVHAASTDDTAIAQIASFIVDVNDSSKGYITVSGIAVGSTGITVVSMGRTVTATVNVEQGDSPIDCPEGQEYANGECFDLLTPSLTANPTRISLGDLSRLTWQVDGATSDTRCDINHDIGGVSAAGGSVSVKPYSSSTYSLTCSDQGRVRIAKASVSVVGNICYSNQEAVSVPQNMWHIKTLPTNAITSDWSLATYLGDGVLSYFFNNFGNPYGKGVDGKAENFIGQGFWLKNESGKDFICYYEGASTPNTTTVEKVLPFKALDMTGNPLGVQMNLADVKFKFSSTGDKVYSWGEATNDGYIKAAFLWNHPTNSYLAYTNLSRYPEFDKYGYESFTNMPKVIGAYEGMWIVPRTTETVTVIYGVE